MTCFDDNVTVSTTYGWDASRAAFDAVMLFLVMVTNASILGVVARRWCTEGMPLGNVTSSLLVVNLSAADFLVGFLGVFHFLPRYLCDLEQVLARHRNLCILRFALVLTAHLGSGYTLIAIAADRYVAVCHALHYRDWITPRRSLALIAGIWVVALSGAMLLFAWNTFDKVGNRCSEDTVLPLAYTLFVGVFGQVVILGTITWAHWAVHRIVLQLRSRGGNSNEAHGGVFAQGEERVSTRASRVLALILGVYVASWAPFMIVLIVRTCKVHVPPTVMETASSIVNFNYLVNPFIYAYNNRPIQKAIHKCVRSFKRKTWFESWNEPSHSLSLSNK
ncbi:hypothetical protein R5R35_012909 [Gryllus longicercus]|uniref:G-protein coupled receptors family 1 profile domain-containing protein n=1 Tax=Gryllus longicercus TaxID=2509291 RepID=A0AAN9Z8P7_9ORTH